MTTKPKRTGRRHVAHATESMYQRDGAWVHEFVLYVRDTMHDTLQVEIFTREPSPAEVAAFAELDAADAWGRVRP